jgi:hypothetical protein
MRPVARFLSDGIPGSDHQRTGVQDNFVTVIYLFDPNLLRNRSVATEYEHGRARYLRRRAEIQAFSVHQGSIEGEQVERRMVDCGLARARRSWALGGGLRARQYRQNRQEHRRAKRSRWNSWRFHLISPSHRMRENLGMHWVPFSGAKHRVEEIIDGKL